MRHIAQRLLDSLPYVKNLKRQVEHHGLYPAGHYYSPIPSNEDVSSHIKATKPLSRDIPGIQMHQVKQRQLLESYAHLYKDLDLPETAVPSRRYYYQNSWFSYSDAIFLHCFLRHHRPKKIVEVGSGFSSAVILDTVDRWFQEAPEITFIEPYPDRLLSLFKADDHDHHTLIDKKIQEVSLDVFRSLQAGDLLFIDSSHVVKCGSDLQLIFFDILPLLARGVFVHFHDVFYPFDYPKEWLLEGRYWNENYFLRAFLSWNSEWQITFFNTYVHLVFSDFLKEQMPLCLGNAGGSLYIQRSDNVSVPPSLAL
jgi:hypothetical protein